MLLCIERDPALRLRWHTGTVDRAEDSMVVQGSGAALWAPAPQPRSAGLTWLARGALFLVGLLGVLAFVGFSKAQKTSLISSVMVAKDGTAQVCSVQMLVLG